MTNLADALAGLSTSGDAIVTPNRRISWVELLRRAAAMRNGDCGEIVVEGCVIDIAVRLIAFDGYAKSILLLPQGFGGTGAFGEHSSGGRSGSAGVCCSTNWVMPTSGTTGTPKWINHSLSSLTRSLKRDRSGRKYRWGLLYDPCRFAGLQVVLQSLIGGGVLLAPESHDVEHCVEFFLREGVTSISATPSMWRKLLLVSRIERLRPTHVTLGGEIADTQTLKRLRLVFPDAKITHIFASTEAGVGFSVKDCLAGFPLSYLKDSSESGVKLKIGDGGVLLIRKDDYGERAMAGELPGLRDDGFLDTGDIVQVVNDRVVFIGRANGSINVGGLKVMPEEVEVAIRECAVVEDVRVYARPSAVLGNVVAADVVAKAGVSEAQAKTSVSQFCSERIEGFKRPAVVRIVSHIETSATGKAERRTP